MSQILPTLYVSDHRFARSLELLRKTGITHIVNLCAEYSNFLPNNFRYLRIPAKDDLQERLFPAFRIIAAFADTAANEGGKCLIHCQQGFSRSATGALACLIINERMLLAQALALVRAKHPDADPNDTFLGELARLERVLRVNPDSETWGPADWKECLAVVLANTKREGMDIATELGVIEEWFQAAVPAGAEAVQERLKAFIHAAVELRGSDDTEAREILKDLVQHSLLDRSNCSAQDFNDMLAHIKSDAEFRALPGDDPEAMLWLELHASETLL